MPYIYHFPLLRYGVVVLIVALTFVLTLVLDPWLGMSESPFLLFFSAVMVSAWYGGLKLGLLATLLSALLGNYFFLFPKHELSFDLSSLVQIGLFGSQGFLFSILCEALMTAKRHAEGNLEKLRTSEERFRLALSSSDIVVFQQDQNLRYQWIHNPQGVEAAEEMLGKTDYELFCDSQAKQLAAIKQRVIETGASAREEVSLTVREEARYYDLIVEPLKSEANSSIQGVSCAAVNITERKQAELENAKLQQKLQEANQRKDESLALFDAWLTSSPVALTFLDTELRYVYANEALAATNGVPQSQHIGHTLGEVLPEWVEQLEPILRQVMQTKEPLLNQEVSGETYPPGVYRCGLVSYHPVCLADGQLLGVGVTGIDITQLKQTEQALRESEAKFRSVVESNMIGIGFWDRDGGITEANDALLNMVGYTREELLAGRLNWQDLTPAEYQLLDEQALTQFQNNLFCTPFEKEYIRKDGSRFPILVGGSHFEETSERGAFFVLDITERKQAEDALRCIAQTSTTLSTSLDYEETLEQIAKILVPQLADWCCVDIIDEDGSVHRLAVAHADSSKAEWARQLQQYVPDSKDTSALALPVAGIARVLQTGQPELITEVSDSLLAANTQNNEHLQIVRQMGIKSAMIVPLVARQKVLGSITFISAESERHYEQCDLALATDIACRAALAFENARLYRDIHKTLLHYAESLSLLDALLAGAPVAVCFLDRELRYIRINKVLADINGLSIEEHLGRKFREVLPKMAAEFEPQLQQVLDTGEPLLNVEISGETREQPSRYSYWLGNYYPVYNALSETVGIGIILADMTATKQTEVALRDSEEKFRTMFNQAVVGINLVALDGRYLQVNPAMCDITGYSSEELTQMTFQEITHPDDIEPDLANAQRVLAGEISGYSLEKRYIRKDGSLIWVNLTSSIVWDADGQPKYALGVVEDISDRQAAQRDRQKAEAAQNFLVEASTLLASSLDYEVTLTNVANLAVPTLADLCIVDIFREDWSNKQMALVTADPGKRQILAEIQRDYSSQNGAQQFLVYKLRQGESVFFSQFPDSAFIQMAQNEKHLQLLRSLSIRSLMVIPLRSRGQLFGAIAFFTAESGRYYEAADLALAEDVARRAATAIDNARLYQETQQAKQAAERAVNRTVLLQTITAALSEALTPQQVADVVMNQGIAALGAKAGSVLLLTEGNSLKIVQAIGYQQSTIDAFDNFPLTASIPSAETVRTGEPIFIENREAWIEKYPNLADIPPKTGYFAYACIPLMQDGKAIGALGLNFATAQAFSEEDQGFMWTLGQQCAQAIARAQLYEAEQRARNQAETANRIKDEFLAVLSHELRTPLNPILGWAKLLRTRKFDEATVIRALETIERNANLQTQLIEDLLDVSRILRGKLSLNIYAVDLNATIAAALETVRLAAEAKSIEIQMVLSNDVGQVMGDGDRLQQVIWNLVSNAVKFTPPGGRVEVRLEQVDFNAQIQVIDTGKGINPEFLPHVFEYFRQADAKTTRIFGGLGLGLAIVRNLVELHGGTVEVESAGEGQGATFTVKLPVLKSSESQVMSAESSVLEASNQDSLLSGVRILLVDDQPDVRDFFSFALEQFGATVTSVESATEALKALAQLKPDILLSDIGMPIMDGYMLLREIRTWSTEQGGQIPAIALTAYAGEIDYNQAIAAGFQKHVRKPADPFELATAIANLIGRNQP
ncbi:PAS domain S-box protein [Komarekiella sp. 'clone 1']|uniref:Circadian input-output histidine kinase CikA n=1 Tax=Komarekiella delphini-convector SJRDD-AB1 TaxID=2593771 RepID=A0AA40T3U8_9NOST|nr:PAS domain S-box protein [Komarekiella delphini-convector]MBD6620449.1 PAS domain S-box protein [Komarekiella delphini-convector SJRDD-AB1]